MTRTWHQPMTLSNSFCMDLGTLDSGGFQPAGSADFRWVFCIGAARAGDAAPVPAQGLSGTQLAGCGNTHGAALGTLPGRRLYIRRGACLRELHQHDREPTRRELCGLAAASIYQFLNRGYLDRLILRSRNAI